MSELHSIREAKMRLMRNNPHVVQQEDSKTILDHNLEILESLKTIIQNNPTRTFSEIIGGHLMKDLNLNEWSKDEVYD